MVNTDSDDGGTLEADLWRSYETLCHAFLVQDDDLAGSQIARISELRRDQMTNRSLESWMQFGSCRDYPPVLFFPSDAEGVKTAVEVCGQCPVREVCLEYALVERVEHGVWGGESERRRRRLLRTRDRQAQPLDELDAGVLDWQHVTSSQVHPASA